ncbi:MAG TPA: phosphatase PAP2 family protein [Candidatus Limnocylindrales bacterium]|nr:phosphatase PAP2 family protein [Candidatus Limnocylindrales bacterium]
MRAGAAVNGWSWRAAVVSICAAVAGLTAYGIGRWAWLDEVDVAAHRWAPEFPRRIPFVLAQLGFDLGDARGLTWVGLSLAAFAAWRLRRWYPLMVYIMVWVFHTALIQVLKVWASRGQPDTEQPLLGGIAGGTSFPSGHSASAVVYFALAGALLAALTGDRRWNGRMAAVAAVVTTLCAASIFYLGYHWVSDVVAGTAIGIAEWVLLGPIARRLLRVERPTEALT